jgi:hypothetical protein
MLLQIYNTFLGIKKHKRFVFKTLKVIFVHESV